MALLGVSSCLHPVFESCSNIHGLTFRSDSSEFSRSGSTSSSGSSHMSRSCSREGSEQRDRNIIRLAIL